MAPSISIVPQGARITAGEGRRIPDERDAVEVVIRDRCQQIAETAVMPEEGLTALIRETNDLMWKYDHEAGGGYVGCAFGVEQLIGLYWERDETRERALDGRLADEDEDVLRPKIVRAAATWLDAHPG